MRILIFRHGYRRLFDPVTLDYRKRFFSELWMYRSLDPDQTIATLKTLGNRIEERFPRASLGKVCQELLAIAEETTGRIKWLSKQHAGIRLGVIIVVGVAVYLGWHVIGHVKVHRDGFSIEELDAATNATVLFGAALLFLITLESRLKRSRVLRAINELRAISHVIDMHQLTKDPSHVVVGVGERTASSPQRTLTAYQLTRYLDYCSEMLSLVGKLAALYAQSTSDSVVLQSVNDIETLTNGISRKIWQKIMILDDDLRPETPVASSGSASDSSPSRASTPSSAAAPERERMPVSEPKMSDRASEGR
jgi:hypothetical protein